MSKTKQDYINDLVSIAFRMDEKANQQKERTKRAQRMASLARQGLKDSEEFKRLDTEFRHPTVTNFGNEMNDLQRVVKQLKRYKWE